MSFGGGATPDRGPQGTDVRPEVEDSRERLIQEMRSGPYRPPTGSKGDAWFRTRLLSLGLGLGGVALLFVLLWYEFAQPAAMLSSSLACLGLVAPFVLIALSWVVYRCPYCGGYPGRGFWGPPEHCVSCGHFLS